MQTPRGKFLSGLIVLNASAISLATLALLFNRNIERALGSFPNWFNPFLVVFLLARLVTLFAIWNFRRWGAYLFFLLECLEVALGLFVFTSVLTFPLRFMLAMPSFLILLTIWFLALRPKWPAFT
jgi:hypothetical protein